VVGLHGFVDLGGTLVDEDTLLSARAGFGGKFRRHKYWGFTLRLEGGADYDPDSAKVGGAFAVLLGGAFSRPTKKRAN
jgi:hypothetical protein